MKNLIKSSLIVLLVSVMLTSCQQDELLNPIPETSISDKVAFDTRARIIGQVNGIYASFRSGQYLGGRFQVYNDIRSDDYLNLGQNGVTGLQTWNHTLTPAANEVQNLWVAVYEAIGRINMFLEGMADNRANIISRNLLTEAEYNQFVGEALALRGMAYHHLMMLYARPFNQNPQGLGAVLRLTASRSGANNDLARVTLEATYTQILKDLNDAEPLLPALAAGTANTVALVSRVHRNTVIAFKTRVLLHQNNWAAVRTEANKIVPAAAPFVAATGVAHGLAHPFAAIFASPYTSRESIFSMPFNSAETPGTQNGLAHYFSAATVGNNEYPINQASTVWASTAFPTTDARRALTRTATIGGATHIFINKYPTFPHTDFAPVIRYAEVLLNLAEAEARIAWPSTRAVALLNEVFLRSNPGATPLGGFASADAFVDRVMLERNMEFLGEGIRNMDTQRRQLPHLAKPGVGPVPVTATNYVWPIPENERNTNLLVQPN